MIPGLDINKNINPISFHFRSNLNSKNLELFKSSFYHLYVSLVHFKTHARYRGIKKVFFEFPFIKR
ncbi:hypothetical protein LEP1GSC038_1565 [Leptospira weilii str. 2006001855]|uniref:Uncharacterized protein n=1 Tax=Leptospira weilii str. 2006001855 TaxID=996804 RepID=M6FF08_9LEPT|nr:hypothetical protein LEP1GSC038_1565 [Leptospira weilii str. 2006001855]